MKLKETLEKQGGLRLIKRYIKGGAFFTAVGELLLLGKSRTALEILRNAASLKIIQKLEKKYSKTIREIEKTYSETNDVVYPRKIWFCWFQGLDKAPEIVNICFKSIQKCITDREIVLITEKNYHKYISFPEEIQNKIDNEVITGAHLSDLVRLELLYNYGGTWIDATVFCSSKNIPTYMLDSDLFLFQCLKPGKDGQPSIISNWFITSKPNHKYIYILRELMYNYWKKNNDVVDYFIFHDFFQLIIDRYPAEWDKVIPFSNSIPHILLLRLFDKYDSEIWDATTQMSPFHKLSYKFDEKFTTLDNTFYKKIIKLYSED